MIIGHGDDAWNTSLPIVADFSSNIPYRNSSASICHYLQSLLQPKSDRNPAQRYPDPTARELSALIAAHHGVLPSQVLVTNGSTEAFYLTALWLRKQNRTQTLIATPAFAEYEDACRLYGHQIHFTPLNQIDRRQDSSSHSLWLGAPNNPDGYLLSSSQLDSLLNQNRDRIVVVDAAYEELCVQRVDFNEIAARHSNLVVIHSLTKSFAIPGLRLGYIIASEAYISELFSLKLPWSVNGMALAAGSYIMSHYSSLLPPIDALLSESQEFQKQLQALGAIDVLPSDCNFFLCRLPHSVTAAHFKPWLLKQHGILIRNADNFRGLTPQHWRLSVQGSKNNALLIEALQQYLSLFC